MTQFPTRKPCVDKKRATTLKTASSLSCQDLLKSIVYSSCDKQNVLENIAAQDLVTLEILNATVSHKCNRTGSSAVG